MARPARRRSSKPEKKRRSKPKKPLKPKKRKSKKKRKMIVAASHPLVQTILGAHPHLTTRDHQVEVEGVLEKRESGTQRPKKRKEANLIERR